MSHKQFCKLLRHAIADEKKAPKDYATLRKHAPTRGKKAVISGISEDERKHYMWLKKMYSEVCKR